MKALSMHLGVLILILRARVLMAIGPTAMVVSKDMTDRIFVSTDNGHLSAVSVRDGSQIWNSPSAGDHGSVVLMKVEHGTLFTGHSSGTIIAWRLSNGGQLWANTDVSNEQVIDLHPVSDGVIVVSAYKITRWSISGELKWTVSASNVFKPASWVSWVLSFAGKVRFWASSVATATEICVVAGTVDTREARVQVLEVESGKVLREMEVPENFRKNIGGKFLSVGDNMAAIEGETLVSCPICHSHQNNVHTWDLKLVRVSGKEPNNFFVPWTHTPGAFLVSNGHFTFLFRITSEGLKPYINNAVSVVGPVHGPSSAKVAMVAHKGDSFHMKMLSETNADVGDHTLGGYSEKDNGALRHVVAVEKTESHVAGKYVLLLGAEDSLVATDGSSVLWRTRFGAIAVTENQKSTKREL